MKQLNVNEMQNLQAGYCDAVIYALTGVCTNPGCIVTGVYNTVAGPLGLPTMVCAL